MSSFFMGGTLPPSELRSASPAGASYRTPPRTHATPKQTSRGFTLVELAVVVMILSLLAAAALRYSEVVAYNNNVNATNATLDVIETALTNFRYLYNRLPCPADITTYAETNANFGIEASASGDCYSTGSPKASYENTGTDPDNADTNYDSTTVSEVVAGGVPTKTLKLADKYAYDAWGRRILYVADNRITATNAFLTYAVTSSTACKPASATIGAIVIKKNAGDALANAITCKAIYALVSFGANGHGGYARNLTGTPVRFNASSQNTDQQKNCHCDSTTTATAFDRIFVQKAKTNGATGSITNVFDDIVRYKTRGDMASGSEMQ